MTFYSHTNSGGVDLTRERNAVIPRVLLRSGEAIIVLRQIHQQHATRSQRRMRCSKRQVEWSCLATSSKDVEQAVVQRKQPAPT